MDAVGDHHILAGLDPENRRSTIRLAKHHVLANIGAGVTSRTPRTGPRPVDAAFISVIPSHVGWTSTNPCDDDSIHGLELCEAQEIVRKSGLEPTLLEHRGEPAETIERVAEAGNYDLIVVGSRSPENQAAGYLGNSVSEHVAAHAPMTVVIAR